MTEWNLYEEKRIDGEKIRLKKILSTFHVDQVLLQSTIPQNKFDDFLI